jgi:hypothetical protein
MFLATVKKQADMHAIHDIVIYFEIIDQGLHLQP